MTRLARAGKCRPSEPREFAVAPCRTPPSRWPNAREPRPRVERARKFRRVSSTGSFIKLIASDGFIEVENQAGQVGVSGQLNRIEVGIGFGGAHRDKGPSCFAILTINPQAPLDQRIKRF